MPGYENRALAKFKHPAPSKPQYALHSWVEPVYGSCRQQYPTIYSIDSNLYKEGTKRVQFIAGTFIYYGHSVDPCILLALNEISLEQLKPTTNTISKFYMLINYLHTYPDGII